MDITSLINLILCVIIVFMGCWGYRKINKTWPLCIAIGFGLFGLTHLLRVIGIGETWDALMIAIRICGYLSIIYALYSGVLKK